jgi:hypothetical protein
MAELIRYQLGIGLHLLHQRGVCNRAIRIKCSCAQRSGMTKANKAADFLQNMALDTPEIPPPTIQAKRREPKPENRRPRAPDSSISAATSRWRRSRRWLFCAHGLGSTIRNSSGLPSTTCTESTWQSARSVMHNEPVYQCSPASGQVCTNRADDRNRGAERIGEASNRSRTHQFLSICHQPRDFPSTPLPPYWRRAKRMLADPSAK